MSMSWRLRRADPEDAVLLSRLKIKTYSLNYRGILPDDMLDGAEPDNPYMGVERWRSVLLDPENEAWVVETGEPAGFICLTPPPDYVPQARSFLDQLYLLPSWQSGGIGSGILRHLMEDLRRRRALPLALTAVEGNDRARKFYEGHGGHAIDLILGFTWQGRPFYEIVYLFDST